MIAAASVGSKTRPLRLLGITNSLRADSLNRMALALAGECLPEGAVMDVHDIKEIPLYTHELEQQGIPVQVSRLTQALAGADGLVLSSPEYNHSIPPAIKNVIDWASRVKPQPFDGKPVMLISATPGLLGGARVQYELRRVLDAVNAQTLVRPEVFIGGAHQKFNAAGVCIDEPTSRFVGAQVLAFLQWIQRLKRLDGLGPEQA